MVHRFLTQRERERNLASTRSKLYPHEVRVIPWAALPRPAQSDGSGTAKLLAPALFASRILQRFCAMAKSLRPGEADKTRFYSHLCQTLPSSLSTQSPSGGPCVKYRAWQNPPAVGSEGGKAAPAKVRVTTPGTQKTRNLIAGIMTLLNVVHLSSWQNRPSHLWHGPWPHDFSGQPDVCGRDECPSEASASQCPILPCFLHPAVPVTAILPVTAAAEVSLPLEHGSHGAGIRSRHWLFKRDPGAVCYVIWQPWQSNWCWHCYE